MKFHSYLISLPWILSMMLHFARKYKSSGLAVVSLLLFIDLVGFGFFWRMHCCQGAAVRPRGFRVTLSTSLWLLSAELISLDGAPHTQRSVTIFTFPFLAAKGPAFSSLLRARNTIIYHILVFLITSTFPSASGAFSFVLPSAWSLRALKKLNI